MRAVSLKWRFFVALLTDRFSPAQLFRQAKIFGGAGDGLSRQMVSCSTGEHWLQNLQRSIEELFKHRFVTAGFESLTPLLGSDRTEHGRIGRAVLKMGCFFMLVLFGQFVCSRPVCAGTDFAFRFVTELSILCGSLSRKTFWVSAESKWVGYRNRLSE
jgi:hypothetical protein